MLDVHSAVKITDPGDGRSVDATGQGLVARQDLREGWRIPDTCAVWCRGQPPLDDYTTVQVPTLGGYFEIRRDGGEVPFVAPAYYLNEARGGTQPNVKWSWTRTTAGAFVLVLAIIRDVRAGEELLVLYNS